ncbi:MAG: DUF932 domain-containing protein [Chromatiaceae bacterium]|nr:DUF932 domain-containing protein [Chromatiaceae bacterium]
MVQLSPAHPAPVVDLFFPVEMVPAAALLSDVTLPSNYQAVVRTDTQTVLGIHGPGYRLLRNEEALGAFDAALRRTPLEVDGMQVKDELSYSGARAYRTYTFPTHSVAIGRANDHTHLKLMVSNSYDGSLAFTSRLGAYRLLCANGMVIGTTFLHAAVRHTKRLSVATVVERLSKVVDLFHEQTQHWRAWSHLSVSADEVRQVLRQLPALNPKLEEQLFTTYLNEAELLGPSLWALFNSLTHWSTHAPVRERSLGNLASIRQERESRVKAVITSEPFRRLALAA